ncbi:CHAT domain-containing protein [Bradyrhizobium cenepequi]
MFDAVRLLNSLKAQRLAGVCGQDRLAAAERLDALTRDLKQPDLRSASLLELADAWLHVDPKKAIERAKLARSMTDMDTAPNLVALALTIEAEALLLSARAQCESAHKLTQLAVKLARRNRERVTEPIVRATSMRDQIRVFESAVRAALAIGRVDLALETAEWSRPSLPGEQPPRLNAVKDSMKVGELAIIYTWLGPSKLHIAVLDQNSVEAVEIEIPSEALSSLELFADQVRSNHGPEDNWKFSNAQLQALDAFSPSLFPPLVTSRLGKIRKLFILPHRILHAIPFGLPRVDGTRLGLRCAWALIPNLGALIRRVPTAPERGLIALGIDHYSGLLSTDGFGELASELATLHGARSLSGMSVRDPGAYEAFLKLAAEDEFLKVGFVVLACHGASVRGDDPEKSYLAIGDRTLTAATLEAIRMRTDIVVLAACCSGQRAVGGMGIHTWPGDDLFGLQASLWRAGTRQVIGALWEADVEAVAMMARLVHHSWLNGLDAAEGLHAAVVGLDAHLFHGRNHDWAPFVAVQFGRDAK